MFGCVCYIWNQRDHHLKFEANAAEGVFLGYFSVSKDFRVFNFSRKIIEETIHVNFDEHSFIHDQVDHPSSILNKHTYNPSDPVLEFLQSDVELLTPNQEDEPSNQVAIVEEDEPSNQDDSIQSNIIEHSNPRDLKDHPESQIIRDVNSRIPTRSRVNINFCMFINLVSMIEPKNVVDALKATD